MLYTILYYWGLGCMTLLGSLILIGLIAALLLLATDTAHVAVKYFQDAKEPPQ